MQLKEALELFDSLWAVNLDEIRGVWHGEGMPTGHPMDGLLECYRWYGKDFRSPEDVQPLLFEDSAGQVYPVNPALVPLGWAVPYLPALKNRMLGAIFARVGMLFRARKPGARLRMVEYRGVVTATMIYDALPICDHFRWLDESTLLGAMDFREFRQPFFFKLRRA